MPEEVTPRAPGQAAAPAWVGAPAQAAAPARAGNQGGKRGKQTAPRVWRLASSCRVAGRGEHTASYPACTKAERWHQP
eukprot:6741800-Heterocapsa_arctica.AAC.1